MGLLDGGIAAVFGAAFGGLYLPARLFSGGGPIYDDSGNIIGYDSAQWPCRAQVDSVDWSMRDGYVDGDVRIIILSAGLPGAVTADHEIEVQAARFALEGGRYQRWAISAPSMDAAGSHWVCRGRITLTPLSDGLGEGYAYLLGQVSNGVWVPLEGQTSSGVWEQLQGQVG